MTQTQTQTRGQNSEFQPSEASSIRMAVIEHRHNDGHEWVIHSVYDIVNEADRNYLIRRCRSEPNKHPEREYRYRYGSLILENSDKCEIFKTE